MKPLRLIMQAFGPFAARESIDFTNLGQNPLFLINGVTGSGKSSILDAICFALYGQTTDTQRDGSSMRCDYAASDLLTEIIFDFALSEHQYRIRRTPTQEQAKKRGEGTTTRQTETQLWRAPINLESDTPFDEAESELLVAKKATEANAIVAEITGLSVEQFRQVMVLPQGKFRDLLLADSKDREVIFSQLFQTHIYKRIEDRLKEQSSAIRREREQLQNQVLGLLASADFSERQELEQELLKLEPELADRKLEFTQANAHYLECQQVLSAAEQLQLRLREREQLQSQQQDLHKQALEVDGWRTMLQRGTLAELIDPLYRQQLQAQQRCQQSETELQLQRQQHVQIQADLSTAEESDQKVQAQAQQIEPLQRRQQELQRLQQQVDKLLLAQQQQQEMARLQLAAEQECLNKQQSLQASEMAVAEFESQLNNSRQQLQELSGLQQQLLQLKSSGQNLAKLQQLRDELQASDSAVEALRQRLLSQGAARDKQYLVQQQSEFLWHTSQASILALQLRGGEPCPVCGSCEHPTPASLPQPDGGNPVNKEQVDAEREKTQRLETVLHELEQELYGLQKQRPTIEEHINSLLVELGGQAEFSVEQMRAHYAQVNAKVQSLLVVEQALGQQEVELEGLKHNSQQLGQQVELARQNQSDRNQECAVSNAALQELEREVDEDYRVPGALAKQLQQLGSEIESLQQALISSQQDLKQAQQRLVASESTISSGQVGLERLRLDAENTLSAWLDRLGDSEFDSAVDYQQAVLQIEQKQELEQKVSSYEQLSAQLLGRLKQLDVDIGEGQLPDIEALQESKAEAEAGREKAEALVQALTRRQKQLIELEKKLQSSRRESIRLDEQYSVFGTLSDVASGQNGNRLSLQRFVLGVLLDDVLIQATERLQLMSQGRYQLLRKEDRAKGNKASGLELEVEDAYTGKTRAVATLSGGESFMAALSLALGLSDVVQAYSGGVKLDTLFIDEGFGSLDPESLDLAVRTLMDLQAGGRTIGIISHVSELKEQMALRIDVEASRLGSKVSVSAA